MLPIRILAYVLAIHADFLIGGLWVGKGALSGRIVMSASNSRELYGVGLTSYRSLSSRHPSTTVFVLLGFVSD